MMDTTNPTPATTTATDSAAATDTEATLVKMYPTKAEAEAAKPADAPKSLKPMEVSKNGTVVGWVLCRGYDHGLSICAKLDGYTISTGTKAAAAPPTKEQATAVAMAMTDDEFKQLVAARKAAAKKS